LAAELIDAAGSKVDGRVAGDRELAAKQVEQFGVFGGQVEVLRVGGQYTN
jgi:hypothetical protein